MCLIKLRLYEVWFTRTYLAFRFESTAALLLMIGHVKRYLVRMPCGFSTSDGRCCRTLAVEDSQCESMRLDGSHEQTDTRPLPHDELVQLHCFAAQARVAADLVGQGDDLARAA